MGMMSIPILSGVRYDHYIASFQLYYISAQFEFIHSFLLKISFIQNDLLGVDPGYFGDHLIFAVIKFYRIVMRRYVIRQIYHHMSAHRIYINILRFDLGV